MRLHDDHMAQAIQARHARHGRRQNCFERCRRYKGRLTPNIRRRRPKKKCQTWGPQIAWSRMSRMHGHPLAGMLVGVRLDQLKGLVPAKSHALPKRVQRSCLPVSFLPFFPTCVSCMCILGELDIAVVNWTCRSFFEAIHKQEKPTCTDPCLNNRRKFRSQTSDNMDRWKAEQGRGREKRKMRRKKSRRERVRRKKMQMREKVGKSRNTVFFNDLGLRRVEK